jgi:N-acetyl-anhydromuramyl-L-alanine amidase AmpD
MFSMPYRTSGRLPVLVLAAFLIGIGAPSRAADDPSVVPAPELPAAPTAPAPTAPPAAEPVEPSPTLPAPPAPPRTPWRYIVIHHSASAGGNAYTIDQMHRRKGWDGIAYHFLITNGKGGPDGGLYVSPRWKQQKHGAHAGGLHWDADPEARNGYNEFGIGICLVGNFQSSAPTRRQLSTLAKLVRELRAEHRVPADHIVGHRHVKGTACPGSRFPWRKLFAWVGLPKPQHLFRRPPTLTTARCAWCDDLTTVAAAKAPPAAQPAPPAADPPAAASGTAATMAADATAAPADRMMR